MKSDYFGKLREASAARDSLLCIGLDPEPRLIGGAGVETAIEFCHRVIDNTADIACCYKPNAAFWEEYGPKGWEALATLRGLVPSDVPVLWDCKRADVPNTMAAYADRGVYVVCHTSNPGRADLQDLECGERQLFMEVAALAMRCDRNGNAGVVMGATATHEVALVRERFPTQPLLLPGIGRQGGNVEAAVRAAFNGDPASCLIAVAGAVMYADDPRAPATSWRDRIRAAAEAEASHR